MAFSGGLGTKAEVTRIAARTEILVGRCYDAFMYRRLVCGVHNVYTITI